LDASRVASPPWKIRFDQKFYDGILKEAENYETPSPEEEIKRGNTRSPSGRIDGQGRKTIMKQIEECLGCLEKVEDFRPSGAPSGVSFMGDV